MAQTIETITNNGIFQASEFQLVSVTEAEFKALLSDCKEPITVIAEAPAGASDCKIICKGAEKGYCNKEILLTAGKMNVFRMETKGFKNSDGFIEFESQGFSGGKIAFLKYSAVINH